MEEKQKAGVFSYYLFLFFVAFIMDRFYPNVAMVVYGFLAVLLLINIISLIRKKSKKSDWLFVLIFFVIIANRAINSWFYSQDHLIVDTGYKDIFVALILLLAFIFYIFYGYKEIDSKESRFKFIAFLILAIIGTGLFFVNDIVVPIIQG
ncbi:hypothetical protein [Clostridium sp. 'White wine YQ']|uniref:hypothetical protein n=1 Tax=Clostridium sp. 'White wine YQ' TaxID=3027474 RepID=UPI002365F430|nr:hypothetical protein [Clostridium sp. 'White wine YQ']MDD7794287.1 hypothetical protein [Clostridium sp. 'White wine YQ']